MPTIEVFEIHDGDSFKTAIESACDYYGGGDERLAGQIAEVAEKWLARVKRERYEFLPGKFNPDGTWTDNGLWVDHCENMLFHFYVYMQNWNGAQRMIDSTEDTPHASKYDSKKNRQKKLDEEKREG